MHEETVLATTVLIEGFKQIGTILNQMTACLERIPREASGSGSPTAAATKTPRPLPYPVTRPKASKDYTFEEVREILTTKAASGYRAEVKAILVEYKLGKLSDAKDKQELLNGLIEKPRGKPALVPESDQRPAYNTAEQDFRE